MDRQPRWMASVYAIVLLGLALPEMAHAYLDPGTGSYLMQILLASLFGALYAVKVFWVRIRACVDKILGRESASTESNEEGAGKSADG